MSNVADIDIQAIMAMIPHRYPLLLVDKVIDLVPNQSAVGIKNVTFNEPHFQGHFPGKPIMPGVLIVEALAQTSGIVVLSDEGVSAQDKLVYFMSIDHARFRKPVVPGDTLYLHVHKEQSRGSVWRFKGEAKVGGKKVAEAIVTAMIVEKSKV